MRLGGRDRATGREEGGGRSRDQGQGREQSDGPGGASAVGAGAGEAGGAFAAGAVGLRATGVSWNVGRRTIVDDVSLAVPPGAMLGLLGPNGSGKSSLLRLLAGVRRPDAGFVALDGRDLTTFRRRDVARRVAVVEQHATTEVDLTVSEVVGLGRIPHRAAWQPESVDDRAAVATALQRTGLADAGGRSWHTLSGGERQRAHIARALAQEPRELLLDEPTNHLDIHHQLELLALVRRLPVTSVVALHDLNLAAMFCDHLVVLAAGRVVASGTPGEVLTPELIAEVYRVRAVVTPDGPGGVPAVRFEPEALGHAEGREGDRRVHDEVGGLGGHGAHADGTTRPNGRTSR